MNKISSWLSLFTSFGTLICCAIPSLLVFLGLGSSLAGFIGLFPQVVWLSKYKEAIFLVSGGLIFLAFLLSRYAENQPCPVDINQREVCTKTKKSSKLILGVSAIIWFLGFLFSYLLPLIG